MRKIAIASLVALAVIFSSMPVRAEVVEEVVAEKVDTPEKPEVDEDEDEDKSSELSEPTIKLPPLPKVDTDQLYAREKKTELESDGQLVTTLTYKTPTQAFSEQHQQIDGLST